MEAGLKKAIDESPFFFDGIHQIRKKDNKPVEINISSVKYNGRNVMLCLSRNCINRNEADWIPDMAKQKQAEMYQVALHESEKRYRLITENTADTITMLDINLHITYVSPSIEKLRGFSVDEAMKQPLDQIFVPESLKIVNKAFAVLMDIDESSGDYPHRTQTLELEEYCKDGSVIWVEVTISLLRDDDNKPKEILTVTRDILKRKQAELALEVRDKLSQSLLRLSKCLELAQSVNQILKAAKEEVHTMIGYNNLWIYILDEDLKYAKLLTAGGPLAEIIEADNETSTLTIEGDQMLEEIVNSKDIIVIPDAPLNEKTNKFIVEKLGNRTIVNVPIYLSDRNLGSIGTGTFGDEGVVVPTQAEKEFLMALASHVAVALDRIQLLEQRTSMVKKLGQSEELYRLIAENTADTITVLDLDLNFTYVSPSAHKLRGYSVEETISQPLDQIFTPASREIIQRSFTDHMALEESGEADPYRSVSLELEEYCKDGSIIWVEISVSFIRDIALKPLGILTVSRDITKRKLAELQLIDSEQKYRSLAESSPDNIIRYNTECRAVYINHNMRLSVGPDVVSFLNKTPMESNNYPSTVDYQAKLQQVIKTGHSDEIEVVVPDHSNKLRTHNIRFVTERNNEDKIIGALAIGRDITERKLSEQEIANMNRALRMLSNSNQVLIHTVDEMSLFNEICQNIVEGGGYLLAWVCLLEHDEQKTLRPVAHAGFDSGYIDSANHTWADSERGRGPSGTAIRTGQPCIVHNIETDPTFEPWREDAIQRGYKSIIALPLSNDNQMLGALGIYSGETDAFNDKEVEILKELADDLAFGISSLRSREKKKHAEEALRASEERFSAVFRFSPLAIAICRADNCCFVDVNDVFISTSGYSREEIIGHTTAELEFFINPLERNMIIQRLQKQGMIDSYEFETHNKAGEIRTVISAVTYINIKEVKHYLALILDITERKRSEERLRLVSSALEATANSIVITDDGAKIIWANDAFSKLTGYTLDEAIGRTPRDLVYSGVHSREFYRLMWKKILSGKVWYGEIVNKRKDGQFYTEYLTITPVRDENNVIRHFIAVKQDISAQKKVEKELLKAKENAEESNRLKSAFLATMNHELRTPLNHILGFSDLMRSGAILENMPDYANLIYNSSQNLLEIIESIFELALVEQSEIKLRLQTFKCLDMFLSNKSVLNEILEISGKKDQIELVFIADKQLLLQNITTDRNKINQVLINLFKNAVKFTKSGKIEFGMKTEEPGWLVFYVGDTGIGIPENKHKIIFEFFRQADDSYTREYGGVGIGLAISKKIAEVMNGTLSLESLPNKGSKFYFKIPVALPSFGNAQIDEYVKEIIIPKLQGKTILIAEDDPLSTELIKKYLANTGVELIEATNGKEAIKKLKANPDAILMDLHMPIMDGYTATRIIKSKKPHIPVIAITAYALSTDKNKAIEAGCDGVISKPIEQRILFGELQKLLFLD